MMVMKNQYQINTRDRRTVLKVWPGTEKDPSGLDNVSEALVLISLLTTGGKVGMGQWHRLQPQVDMEKRGIVPKWWGVSSSYA